jgi:hypothetical protein
MGEQHANGSRVSRHRLVADATVGVIATRCRAVTSGGSSRARPCFPNAEKASMAVALQVRPYGSLAAQAPELAVDDPHSGPLTVIVAVIGL